MFIVHVHVCLSPLRALMYYPSVNWPAIWASRPSHMNGETEDQTQNGTEPMDSLELGSGSVALRRHKKAATISHPNRLSYHEAIRIEEVRDRQRES